MNDQHWIPQPNQLPYIIIPVIGGASRRMAQEPGDVQRRGQNFDYVLYYCFHKTHHIFLLERSGKIINLIQFLK